MSGSKKHPLLGTPLSDLANIGYKLDEVDHRILSRYGAWLEGLANGTVPPATLAQERFVKVTRNEVEPETEYEIAWLAAVLTRVKLKLQPPPPLNQVKVHVRKNIAMCEGCGLNLDNCGCEKRGWW